MSVMFFQRHPENTDTMLACRLGVSLQSMAVLVGRTK